MKNLAVKKGVVLKDYQEEAVNFATSRKASLINMKTGTGKSLCLIKTCIDLLNNGSVDKSIVLCTKSALLEVDNDLKGKADIDSFIIQCDDDLKEFYKSQDSHIALLQYEKLNKIDLALFARAMTKIKTCIILDEAHKVKSPKALLTKSIVALRRYMTTVSFLTATPLTTSLLDFFYLVQILDSSIFKNKNTFMNNFVEVRMVKCWKKGGQYPEVVGYKNLELFRDKIKDICYNYYPEQDTEYIIHKTLISKQKEYLEASEGVFDSEDVKIHASRLIDLQKVVDTDPEKIKLYLTAIKSILKEGLITYCHFHETLELLGNIFKRLKIDYRVISGKVSLNERKEIKQWFNSNPKNKVLLISSAGSQSLNLQSVNNMFFYNIPFGFGAFQQAKGRIERLFSNHTQFKIHFILTQVEVENNTYDTIDTYKYELISSYGELTQTVLNADEVPKGQLQSFNKKLIDKMKKSMLWLHDKKKKKSSFSFGETF